MKTLTLLKELYGEEPIKKVVSSGFDSVSKIAAAAPESLAFFAGINEALARQIIASAEDAASVPVRQDYRAALSGAAGPPTSPRTSTPREKSAPPPSGADAEPLGSAGNVEPVRESRDPASLQNGAPSAALEVTPNALDEEPRIDAGQILKGVASERYTEELTEEVDLLDEMGLSDAETRFLEGGTPWSAPSTAPKAAGSHSPSSDPEIPFPSAAAEKSEVKWAPVTDWDPEEDPDPVPHIVRAPELGPETRTAPDPPPSLAPAGPEPDSIPPPAEPRPEKSEKTSKPPFRPSFWRFGK